MLKVYYIKDIKEYSACQLGCRDFDSSQWPRFCTDYLLNLVSAFDKICQFIMSRFTLV